MKYIITGYKGFIGTNFTNLLSERKCHYIGIDAGYKGSNNFDTPGTKHLLHSYNFDLIDNRLYDELEHDISDLNDWCVINFAAYSHVDDSINTPIELVNKNISSTHAISLWCAKNNIPLIHISTDEVLGELSDNDCASTITSPLNPRNPYSYSKAACELLLSSLQHQYPEWNYIITRCVNNFGCYQDPTKLIPVCILNMLNNRKVPVYGQGLQKRSWVPVELHNNVVYELSHLLTTTQIHPTIYHIGSNIEMTNIAILQELCNMMNKNIAEVTNFIIDPRGHAHDYRYALDDSITRNTLPCNFNFDFKQCLQTTVNFYTKFNTNILNFYN